MTYLLSTAYSDWSGYIVSGLLASILVFLFVQNGPRKGKGLALPGPKGLPIIGNIGILRYGLWTPKGIKPVVYVLQALNGLSSLRPDDKIACFRILTRKYAFLLKAESVEVLLSNCALIDKSRAYRTLHSWLGTGLLTSKGEKWRTRRKLLTPTFHYQILEDFLPIFNEQAETLVEKLQETKSEIFDVVPLITHCALDIICETAMGVSIGAQSNSDNPYVRSVLEVSDIVLSRVISPWLWNDFIFSLTSRGKNYARNLRVLHGFTRKVISERKAEMLLRDRKDSTVENSESGGRRRKAFLDLLLHYHLEDPDVLSEEDIREEVDTFTFEGHDTTAMGISWALYLIGLHPEVQEQIHRELDIIFGSDKSGMITAEHLKDMKYLECVIKESQRLYPSVPVIGRELQQDVDICGYRLEKGTLCGVITYQLHRDPKVFPNPERFDPDRFTLEQASGRHPYAYVPFSAGPRNCIGQRFAMMEEKTVIAHILRRYRITSVDPRDKVHIIAELISRSAQGIRLRIQER